MKTSPKISNLLDHQFMNDLFPFYVLIDDKLRIKNYGSSIHKMIQISMGEFFTEKFSISRPLNVKSYQEMIKYKDSLFMLKSLEQGLAFRGQLYFDESNKLLCFLGSPLINNIDELKNQKISLSDFALHDSISQFLFTLQMHHSSMKDALKLADKLKISNVQLQRTNESLDNLIYKLTHDLRAPAINIQSMLKMLGILLDIEPNARASLIFNNSKDSTQKLIQTIDDFLQLSKLERAAPRLGEICDMEKLLLEIEQENRYILEERKVELYKELGECKHVFGIPDDIKSIFQNLIVNSVKYCAEGKTPKIRINAKLEGNYQVFSITDNGIGIDLKNQKNKMFEMFSRLHAMPGIPGTGIGLYMVKRLITRNKGFVEVTSSVVNKGTTFTLSFLNKVKK